MKHESSCQNKESRVHKYTQKLASVIGEQIKYNLNYLFINLKMISLTDTKHFDVMYRTTCVTSIY